MAGSITPSEALIELLASYRDQAGYLTRADNYFRAEPSSVNIGSRIPPALARFRTPWPAVRVATNAFVDRVSLEDLSYETDPDTAEETRDGMAAAWTMAILEALAVGNGFVRTVVKADGNLLHTAVKGRDGSFLEDLDTGEALATMRVHRPRRFRGPVANPHRVTVYTPGTATTFGVNEGKRFASGNAWGVLEEVALTSAPDAMLMRPVINRQRAGDEYGRAEARDLYSLQDQGSRCLTNISIVSDSLAAPQRVLLAANPDSFKDFEKMKTYLDSLVALAGTDVKIDQWPAAQLQPLIEEMMSLSRQVSAVSGIPLSYWGIVSDANGASGDAIRENDARLEIRARQLGAQWRSVIKDQARDNSLLLGRTPGLVEVKMSDPATPTPSAATDAAIKLAALPPVNGQPVVDREYIWGVLRMDPESRQRLREAADTATLDQFLSQGAPGESGSGPPGPPTGA